MSVFYDGSNEFARVSAAFTVSGSATDPSTVSLAVTSPSGTTTTYSYGAAEITKDSTGAFHKDVACTEAGLWRYVWTGTGAASDVERGDWFVEPTGPVLYAGLTDLKSRLDISSSETDGRLLDALQTASREIDQHCRRSFGKTTTASARTFRPDCYSLATVHDFYTTTDLAIAVDYGDDGTYETTLTTSDYELRPLNGIVGGEPGWPYYEIALVGARWFPTCSRRAPIQVTARWGWEAVPAPVRESCLILAADTFKLASAPFGVAGYGDFGPIRVRDNPVAAKKLRPYQLDPVLVG